MILRKIPFQYGVFQYYVTPNTLLYLPLENDYSDHSLNWYLTSRSSPSYAISWWTKQVAYFNGTYIDLSNFRINEDTITILVWAKSTSTQSRQEIFDANDWSWRYTSTTYFWYNWPWNVSNQYWMQHAQPNSSYWLAYSSGWPFKDVWKRIAVVMNTSWIKIYINWVLQSTQSNLSWKMVWTPDASVWWRKHWSTNYFRWYLSEFIWEKVERSEADILKDFNKTKALYWL